MSFKAREKITRRAKINVATVDLHEQTRVCNDLILLKVELLGLFEDVPDEVAVVNLVSF